MNYFKILNDDIIHIILSKSKYNEFNSIINILNFECNYKLLLKLRYKKLYDMVIIIYKYINKYGNIYEFLYTDMIKCNVNPNSNYSNLCDDKIIKYDDKILKKIDKNSNIKELIIINNEYYNKVKKIKTLKYDITETSFQLNFDMVSKLTLDIIRFYIFFGDSMLERITKIYNEKNKIFSVYCGIYSDYCNEAKKYINNNKELKNYILINDYLKTGIINDNIKYDMNINSDAFLLLHIIYLLLKEDKINYLKLNNYTSVYLKNILTSFIYGHFFPSDDTNIIILYGIYCEDKIIYYNINKVILDNFDRINIIN